MLALLFGLVTMALVFDAATKPTNVAEAANVDAAQVADGQRLYENSCITCHGANLDGVE